VLHRDDQARTVAERFDGSWQLFLVDDDASRAGQIALDAAAVVHAAYVAEVDGDREELRLARGGIEELTIDSLLQLPLGEIADIALAVEPGGREHTALLGADGLWVVSSADPGEPGLYNDHVDPTPVPWDGNLATTVSIAVGGDGALHVAWVVPAPPPWHGEVRYATNRSGVWEVETIGAGDGWPSLAVDVRGNPHLSWHLERRGDESEQRAAQYTEWSPVDGIDQDCDGSDG
jgi:hypothetical protein